MRKMKDITDEDFSVAVAEARSMADCHVKLGNFVPNGASRAYVKMKIKTLDLSTEHWGGQSWSKGTVGVSTGGIVAIPLEKILVENSSYNSTSALKKRLIKAGLLELKCCIPECPITDTWLGKPVTLQLDHISGVRTDNRIENLRLICPMCHTQTPTFAGKNKAINNLAVGILPQTRSEKRKAMYKNKCTDCDSLVHRGAKRCRQCQDNYRCIETNPEKYKTMLEIVDKVKNEQATYTALSKLYGISDTMIKKYLKTAVDLKLIEASEINRKPRS